MFHEETHLNLMEHDDFYRKQIINFEEFLKSIEDHPIFYKLNELFNYFRCVSFDIESPYHILDYIQDRIITIAIEGE